MAVVLITGGNKGLGYETAHRLIDLGNKVYIGPKRADRNLYKSSRTDALVKKWRKTNESDPGKRKQSCTWNNDGRAG